MLVWRGDPKPDIKTVATVARDGVGFSHFSFTSHTGTHIDAPSHFVENGLDIDEIDLEKLVGPCRVLDLENSSRQDGYHTVTRQARSVKEILPVHLDPFDIKKGERILFKTGNYKLLKQQKFPNSYISLSLAGAEYLVQKQIILVGTDFLGIEKEKNPGHPVHTTLLKAGIVNVEGLDLENVPSGNYELICLPLKVASDGCPARAVLMSS